MAMPNRLALENVHLNAHSLDVTTSGADRCIACIVSPHRGRLLRYKAIPYTTASGNTVTVTIGTTTVSGITALAFISGAAGGTVYSSDTKTSPIVQQGDVITFTSDAAGGNATVACTFQATIRRI